jgi:hypothetical protein
MSGTKVYSRAMMSVDLGWPVGGFDAELRLVGSGVDNHELVLFLAVDLQQVIPPQKAFDANGESFTCLPWDQTDWRAFQKQFFSMAAFWHRRFHIVPPSDVPELEKGGWPFPKYMPNVECHLQMLTLERARDRGVGKVHTVKVAKLAPGEGPFTASSKALTSETVQPRPVSWPKEPSLAGLTVTQCVAAHEIGHMLCQPHSGMFAKSKACTKALLAAKDPAAKAALTDEEKRYMLFGANSEACYGVSGDKSDRNLVENIMGNGIKVEEFNALTWRHTLSVLLWGKDKDLPETWKTRMGAYSGPAKIN